MIACAGLRGVDLFGVVWPCAAWLCVSGTVGPETQLLSGSQRQLERQALVIAHIKRVGGSERRSDEQLHACKTSSCEDFAPVGSSETHHDEAARTL